jgi:hypothetical protein
MTKFTLADAERANDEWGANCGPGALAAILDITLDEVRPLMGDFEKKHYTNPTLMFDSLLRAGRRFSYRGGDLGTEGWPIYGLARIQWEGPWTKPGVPPRAAYRHTHWVGARYGDLSYGIFDINCMNNGTGWVSVSDWAQMIAPWLIANCVKRGDGGWHITHAVEVARPE